MEFANGHYVFGQFIELSREKRVDKEKGVETNADYVILTTGGRRGVLALKFDSASLSRESFAVLNNAALGDDLVARVRVSTFERNIYYTLEEIVPQAAFVA